MNIERIELGSFHNIQYERFRPSFLAEKIEIFFRIIVFKSASNLKIGLWLLPNERQSLQVVEFLKAIFPLISVIEVHYYISNPTDVHGSIKV